MACSSVVLWSFIGMLIISSAIWIGIGYLNIKTTKNRLALMNNADGSPMDVNAMISGMNKKQVNKAKKAAAAKRRKKKKRKGRGNRGGGRGKGDRTSVMNESMKDQMKEVRNTMLKVAAAVVALNLLGLLLSCCCEEALACFMLFVLVLACLCSFWAYRIVTDSSELWQWAPVAASGIVILLALMYVFTIWKARRQARR